MTNVVVDITMSLDGFVTGPNPGPDNGLGDGGEALHTWVFDGDSENERVLLEAFDRTGAVLLGRKLFDVVDGPDGWNENLAYGAQRGGREPPPNFVLTHERPEHSRLEESGVAGSVAFATDGLEAAVSQARKAAGDKDVTVMGGGNVCGQCIAQGLADEVHIHLAPLILGSGAPLFGEAGSARLEQLDVVVTPSATHLHYRVAP